MTVYDYVYEIDKDEYQYTTHFSLLDWLKKPSCVVLFIFMFGSMVLAGRGQQQALGILLVFAFLITAAMKYNRVVPLPPEIIMYIGWVFWASMTGLFVAADKTLLWYGGLRQVLQVLVLVICVYSITRIHGDSALKAMMFGIIAGAVLQALVTRGSAQAYGGLSRLEGEEERIQGFTHNANTLGFLMVWAMLAVFTFWKQKQGKTHLIVLVGTFLILPLLSYGMLASGSRKSLVGFTFVLAVWLWYALSPRGKAKSFTWKIAVVAVILAVSGPLSVFVLNNTLAGRRMMEKLSGGQTVVSAEYTRYEMYMEGIRMTKNSPIVGVGMNQYRHYSKFGKYSHSNYIEPLATTGIPGFILFQGIFFIPLFRAWRLTKIVDDASLVYKLKIFVILCISILLIGFGAPFYTETPIMALLAMVSAYTYNCLLNIQQAQNPYLEVSYV